jgi:uncharacterized membrane protein
LVVAFTRLCVGSGLWNMQISEGASIVNWPLYVLGIAAVAHFAAARWLTPPAHCWRFINLKATLLALGTILLFLLMNFEIGHVFTSPGMRIRLFDFSGSFARDMTTTISWALFALGLMGIGIWKRQPETRYVGISLLVIALVKLFLHDLDNISNIYRVGVLVTVAIITLAASYLYQRFQQETHTAPDSESSSTPDPSDP